MMPTYGYNLSEQENGFQLQPSRNRRMNQSTSIGNGSHSTTERKASPLISNVAYAYHLPMLDNISPYQNQNSLSYRQSQQHPTRMVSPRYSTSGCTSVTPPHTVTKFQLPFDSNAMNEGIHQTKRKTNQIYQYSNGGPTKKIYRQNAKREIKEEFVELPSSPPTVPKHSSDSIVMVPCDLSMCHMMQEANVKVSMAILDKSSAIRISPSRSLNSSESGSRADVSSPFSSGGSSSDEDHDVASVLCSFKVGKPEVKREQNQKHMKEKPLSSESNDYVNQKDTTMYSIRKRKQNMLKSRKM
jgi:hypothetical protein